MDESKLFSVPTMMT